MKREQRKIVGARSAKTGRFVPLSKLKTAPTITVAVTRTVKPEKAKKK